jgi:D-glycerate 3-kinase
MTQAVAALIAAEHLPASYAAIVDRWWRPLAKKLAEFHAAAGRPIVIGVNGAQGSGKSTLCAFLEHALLPELGLRAVTLSLDDLYLPRADREQLARTVHPLLATRGVPGTHDVLLGQELLAALTHASPERIRIPRFSKAIDDRLPFDQWREVEGAADIVLFEGWCIGATPQPAEALVDPINALEAEEDRDGIWRGHVNAQLAGPYAALFASLDRLVMLKPPGFEAVLDNRLLQERKLRATAATAMTDAQVRRFVLHYERLTRHMFAELPGHADLLASLDLAQNIVRIVGL